MSRRWSVFWNGSLVVVLLTLLVATPSSGQGPTLEAEDDPLEPSRGVPQFFTRDDVMPRPIRPEPSIPSYSDSNDGLRFYHHLRDHPPKVTARYGRPFASKVWRCDLTTNDCFLKNRVAYAPFRRQANFAGVHQALVLDVGLAARSLHGLTGRPRPIYQHHGSRLTSNGYFPATYTDACLTFSYYWNGAGKKSLKVLQRSEETVCVYSDEIGTDDFRVQHAGQWKDVQLQLDLRYGPAKFVIEFTFDSGSQRHPQEVNGGRYFEYAQLGNIAIRDFSIGYGICQQSVANECDSASEMRDNFWRG